MALRGDAIPVPDNDKPQKGDRVVGWMVPTQAGAIPKKYKDSALTPNTPQEALNQTKGLRGDGMLPIDTLRGIVERERRKYGDFVGGQLTAILEYNLFKGGCIIQDDVPRMSVLARLLTSDAFSRMNDDQRQEMLRHFIGNRDRYPALKNLPEYARLIMSPELNPPRLSANARGKAQTYLLATLTEPAKMQKLEALLRSPGCVGARQSALIQQLIDNRAGPTPWLDRPRDVADVLGDPNFSKIESALVRGDAEQLLDRAWRNQALFGELRTLVTSPDFAANPTAHQAAFDALRARIEALPGGPPVDPEKADRDALVQQIQAEPVMARLTGRNAQLREWLVTRAAGSKPLLEAILAAVRTPEFAGASEQSQLERMVGFLERIEPQNGTDRSWVHTSLWAHPNIQALSVDYRNKVMKMFSDCDSLGRADQLAELRRAFTSQSFADMDPLAKTAFVDEWVAKMRSIATVACQDKAELLRSAD